MQTLACAASGPAAATHTQRGAGGTPPQVPQLDAQPLRHAQLGELQVPHLALRIDRQPLAHGKGGLDLRPAPAERGFRTGRCRGRQQSPGDRQLGLNKAGSGLDGCPHMIATACTWPDWRRGRHPPVPWPSRRQQLLPRRRRCQAGSEPPSRKPAPTSPCLRRAYCSAVRAGRRPCRSPSCVAPDSQPGQERDHIDHPVSYLGGAAAAECLPVCDSSSQLRQELKLLLRRMLGRREKCRFSRPPGSPGDTPIAARWRRCRRLMHLCRRQSF